MRSTDTLKDLEFSPSKVKVADWDLRIPIAPKAGPFCRLEVDSTVGPGPGVFAWVVTDKVIHVGHTDDLAQAAHGEFASVTASNADAVSAKVNNLLNAAYKAEHRISWWWRQEPDVQAAAQAADELIAEFDPMGNQLGRRPAAAASKKPGAPRDVATGTCAKASAPAARKSPAKYDPERARPKNLVCPSCFIQVPLTTGWCDDCEIKVAG